MIDACIFMHSKKMKLKIWCGWTDPCKTIVKLIVYKTFAKFIVYRIYYIHIWTLKICNQVNSKSITARSFKLGQLIEHDE